MKIKRYILIDGYNIINSWESLKRDAENSLEDARERFLHIIAEYALYTGQEAWIIYDAHQIKGPLREPEVILGVHIVYTKESQTADSFIEIKVKELSRERRSEIRVATSDWAEQQIILGIGASRVSARELLIEVTDSNGKIKKATDKINQNRTLLGDRIDGDVAKILDDWVKQEG